MFKRAVIHLTEPICHCEEQSLEWTVLQSPMGPSLKVWCTACEVALLIPNQEFKASFSLDEGYPGKKEQRVPQKKGDIIDFTEYLKRRDTGDLPS